MGFYTPPRIKMVRQDAQTSVVLTGGEVIPALIGTSLGKTSQVSGYQASMGTTDVYNLPDLRPAGPAKAISGIRSSLQGGIAYSSPVDYAFDSTLQRITFQDVALVAPYLLSIDEAPAGSSSLSNTTTYYYVVTAIRDLDLTGPVTGETAASNEVSGRPIAATSHLKLTWRPVAGAKGYKIYRTIVQGNYTGSALLATVTSGFVTTYEDTGSATSAGSPPGVLVFARTVSGAIPGTIATGSVATIDVDGTPNVVTLAGTRPSLPGSAASYPVTIVTSTNDTINLRITDSAGAYTTSVVIAAGAYSALAIAAFINAFPFVGGSANGGSGQLVFTADAAGSVSKIEILGGTALVTLGLTVTSATGTGSLPDYNHVTTAALVTAFNLQLTGATASIDPATSRLAVTRNIGGSAHSLQPHANANTLLGFSTTLVTGNDAVAGTALRRPAFHGDLFFIDYTYVTFGTFVGQRFSNLPKLIAEYGLGSNIAIAGTLAMGTSGRGNGASQVVTMSVPVDTLDAHQAALDLLKKRRDVTLVVPLTVIAGINTAAKAHVIEASNDANMRERRAILGTPKGTLTGDENTSGTAIFLARQLDNDRCILVHPWPFVNVQAADGTITETEMDGWVGAAVLAGRIASLSDRATSPTVQQVFGITRLGTDLDEPEMNSLASAGVCVLTEEDGNIIVRDGITTSLDDQALSRIQIGLVDDFLRQTFRKQFKNFRGRKLLPTLLKLIVRRTLRILALFQKLELIAGYNSSSVSAVQDTDVLTTVDANFSYRPMFDVKEITFAYYFDLSTGTIA